MTRESRVRGRDGTGDLINFFGKEEKTAAIVIEVNLQTPVQAAELRVRGFLEARLEDGIIRVHRTPANIADLIGGIQQTLTNFAKTNVAPAVSMGQARALATLDEWNA